MSVQHKQDLFIFTTNKINKIVVAQYCMLQELAIKSKFGVSITHVWCPNIEGISILLSFRLLLIHMDLVKRIWYLSPMRAAKVQASLHIAQSRQNLHCSLIQAVSQEEPSDRKPDPWPLNGWACAVKTLSWRNARRHKFAWRGSYHPCSILGQVMQNCVLCHMQTTKMQISLYICAIWSASLLFAP